MAVAHRPVMSFDRALSRRRLVGRLALAGFSAPVIASILRDSTFAQDATPEATPTAEELLTSLGKSPEMIQRGSTTFETPMALVADDFLTPNDLFFIRSNGPVSIDIPVEEWRLAVTGLVDEELDLTFDDLQGMAARTITAFLECSGNSRSRFDDDPAQVEGTQWENGAIGNAEWTGVSLVEVLNMAGIQEGAVDVVSQGGDFPEMQRGLPLERRHPPRRHAGLGDERRTASRPERRPGAAAGPDLEWHRLHQVGRCHRRYRPPLRRALQQRELRLHRRRRAGDRARARGGAEIDHCLARARCARSTRVAQQLSGFAWSGYAAIDRVEVSTDDGATWNEAEIVEEAGPTSWVRFVYEWDAAPGETTLASRATDQRGLTQPITDDWNAKGYLMNAIHEVSVIVGE